MLLLSFLLLACVRTSYSRDIHFGKKMVNVSGLSDVDLHKLKETIEHLRTLQPDKMEINEEVYKRLSHFEERFGFPFNGEKLVHWLLSRVQTFSYRNTWTVAINQNKGTFFLGDAFFNDLSELERLYLLIHEARHSDSGGYKHIKCPEGFVFISAGQPKKDLQEELACDESGDGAYAFQSAFLFELFAFGLFDKREVGLLYNSSISRVIR
ncbi:MAG TPA: hypothetical protein EYG28_01030 [Nitrospiria bacterium]|nr:hypothetical protein [Candidatus Manganitrophaceae bacterium]